jgi:membrane associated rhomboid family serine protease
MALRWGDADPAIFEALAGNADKIFSGQVWRLLTAPLIHAPDNPMHLLGVLIGLYFLTPSLEERWGARRLLGFLCLSGVIAYSVQALAEICLPTSVAVRLGSGYWFGGVPVIEAVAVAWALNFRGQTVRLFFVLPVTANGLLAFVIGFSILRLVAVQEAAEGLISPFGGLAAGFLLGGGTPSPARRLLLKLRYARLQRRSAEVKKQRSARVKDSRFRVIEGGQDDDDDDDGPKYLN